jgi:hypothetical protein
MSNKQQPPLGTQEINNSFESRIPVMKDGMKTGIDERRGGSGIPRSGILMKGLESFRNPEDFGRPPVPPANKVTTGGEGEDLNAYSVKYFALGLAFFAVSCLIIHALLNQDAIMTNFSRYFYIILFVLTMIFVTSLNIGEDVDSTNLFFKIAGICVALGVVFYGLSYLFSAIPAYSGTISYILYVIAGLTILAIGSRMFIRYLSRLTGWGGFIAQLIFYIPCMLYDGVYYLLDQMKMTSWTVYVLIALEIMVILLYYYLPALVKTGANDPKNSDLLVGDPVFLNKGKKTIAVADRLRSAGEGKTYRRNYCISMWVFINPQNTSSLAYAKETEIFNYGFTTYNFVFTNSEGKTISLTPEQISDISADPTNVPGATNPRAILTDASGNKYTITKSEITKSPVEYVKPMIRYYGGGNRDDIPEERDKFVFYFAKFPPEQTAFDMSNNSFYDVSLPSQKWNHIAVNYNRNRADVFINGKLERTFDMKGMIPEYNELDTITVGDENGVEGAIRNVVYYHHPLSQDEIVNAYNLGLMGGSLGSSPGK